MDGAILAETYLRRRAEDALGTPDVPAEFELMPRVRALVGVGAVDAATGRALVAEYRRAWARRGRPMADEEYEYEDDDDPPPSVDDTPPRLAACPATFELGSARFTTSYAVFGARRTRIAVTIQPDPSLFGGRAGPRFMGGPPFPHPTVRDDRGGVGQAHFNGGGGFMASGGRAPEFTGWLTVHPGLSGDAAWLEFDGERVALREPPAGASCSVEEVDPGALTPLERAARYLRHLASSGGYDGSRELWLAARTLVEYGLLPADSPVIAGLGDRNDAEPVGFGHQHRRRAGRRRRAPLRRPVGLTTPVFGGLRITVFEVAIDGDGLRVGLEGVGAVGGDGHPRIAFTARDDLGNEYEGSLDDFEGASRHFSGTVDYSPGPPADARVLELAFATTWARAVVRVPLEDGAGS